ncbi:hypothetical protein D3C72_2336760 [compost metagenome]
MMIEMTTSRINSKDSMRAMSGTLAPITFLMPISFLRWCVVNMAKPNNPRQATKMVRVAKMVKS